MTDGTPETEWRNPSAPEPGKPTGGHPIAAVVGGICTLWLILWVVIPNPKDQPTNPTTGQTTITPGMTTGTPSAPHVTSRTVAVLPEYNAVAVLVPPDTTDEQVAQLLQRFKKARINETLVQYIPPTTKGSKLGPHAIADIYVFSEKEWATADILRIVAPGPHGPQDSKKKGVATFAEAMGHVRGHYVINLHEAEHRDRASLGYADEDSNTHSPNYKELF
ncbi:MAG TPA: hypothetical protein VGQ07_04980 [Nitrospirales bacterium]|jgi:hypothetical protein|nr:hypothetical protein [Nitrospirales bacterium]